jgi:hypothetical protein
MRRETCRRISTSRISGPGRFVGSVGVFLLPFASRTVDCKLLTVGSDNVAKSGRPQAAIDSTAMAADTPKTLSFRGKTDNLNFLPDLKRLFRTKLPALQLANEQRSLYGLRYHDHERYRCVLIAHPNNCSSLTILQQTLCQQDSQTSFLPQSYTWKRSRVQKASRRPSGQNTGWTVRRL